MSRCITRTRSTPDASAGATGSTEPRAALGGGSLPAVAKVAVKKRQTNVNTFFTSAPKTSPSVPAPTKTITPPAVVADSSSQSRSLSPDIDQEKVATQCNSLAMVRDIVQRTFTGRIGLRPKAGSTWDDVFTAELVPNWLPPAAHLTDWNIRIRCSCAFGNAKVGPGTSGSWLMFRSRLSSDGVLSTRTDVAGKIIRHIWNGCGLDLISQEIVEAIPGPGLFNRAMTSQSDVQKTLEMQHGSFLVNVWLTARMTTPLSHANYLAAAGRLHRMFRGVVLGAPQPVDTFRLNYEGSRELVDATLAMSKVHELQHTEWANSDDLRWFAIESDELSDSIVGRTFFLVNFTLVFTNGSLRKFYGRLYDTGGRHLPEVLVKLACDAVARLFKRKDETLAAALDRALLLWAWWMADNTATYSGVGKKGGVNKILREQFPGTVYIGCAEHRLGKTIPEVLKRGKVWADVASLAHDSAVFIRDSGVLRGIFRRVIVDLVPDNRPGRRIEAPVIIRFIRWLTSFQAVQRHNIIWPAIIRAIEVAILDRSWCKQKMVVTGYDGQEVNVTATERCLMILEKNKDIVLRFKSEIVEHVLKIVYDMQCVIAEESFSQCQLHEVVAETISSLQSMHDSFSVERSRVKSKHPALQYLATNWLPSIDSEGHVDLATMFVATEYRKGGKLGQEFRNPDAVQLTRKRSDPAKFATVVKDVQTGISDIIGSLRAQIGEGHEAKDQVHGVIIAGRLFSVMSLPADKDAMEYCTTIATHMVVTGRTKFFSMDPVTPADLAKTLYDEWLAVWKHSYDAVSDKEWIDLHTSTCDSCLDSVCLRCQAEAVTDLAIQIFESDRMENSHIRQIVQFYSATSAANIRCEGTWDHVRSFLNLRKTVGTRVEVIDGRLRVRMSSPMELSVETLRVYLVYWAMQGAGVVSHNNSDKYTIKWRQPPLAARGQMFESKKRFVATS